MSGDALIIAVFFVTLINILRYLSSLRVLMLMMREANPLLYQQVHRAGGNFFSSQDNISRQKRLYHYIRCQEYLHHHDHAFIKKCNKVRHLFLLSVLMSAALVMTFFLVAFTGL